MSVENDRDYSQGEVRNHHKFFFSTGDTLIQVEKALFKIHRHFLTQYSSVLEGLFELPTGDDGEMHPIPIQEDGYRGWEALLGIFYRDNHMAPSPPSWDDTIALLPIAHKYSMETIENSALERITGEGTTKQQLIDALSVFKKLNMPDMHRKTLEKLALVPEFPTYEEAREMGLVSFYTLVIYYSLLCTTCMGRSVPVCQSCHVQRAPVPGILTSSYNRDWRN
ncbi:hypothetical protein FRC17_010132 [Serendipita sp. 399]|nr:hypothetical protein FRC17_010132 [Serendipita sp. 399]